MEVKHGEGPTKDLDEILCLTIQLCTRAFKSHEHHKGLHGCHRITDTGIVHLSANMRILEILGLSLGAEQLITETAGVAITAIQTLKVLKFDGRWDVSSPTRDRN